MSKSLKTIITTAIAAISGLLFFSCNQAEELKGNWNTCTLEKDGVTQEIVPSNISFSVQGNMIVVSGESGVNFYNGSVVANKGKISFVNVGSTKMMGAPAEMAFEDLFLEAISFADSYSVNDDVLTITSSKKNLKLQFKKAN